jgi:hypothetical protein
MVVGSLVALIGCGGGGGPGGGGGGSTGASGNTGASGSTGGSGGGAPTTSGVQGSKRLDSLTLDEKKKFCDFQAAHFGGYGQSIDCGGGTTVDAAPSQADCLAKWPTTCAATVTQGEACGRDISCADPIPASCGPILQCQ